MWVLLLLAVGGATFSVMAQDYTPIAPLRTGTYYVNVPTPLTLPKGVLEVRFTHRFAEPVNDGDSHDLWGLDGSADIGIGVAWGFTESLQAELFRTDVQDNIEAALKWRFLRQAPDFPVSITLRGGTDILTEENIDDRTSLFLQTVVSRQMSRRLELFAVPTYANEAGSFDHAFNVPFGLIWFPRPNMGLVLELIPENRDLPDAVDSSFGWAVALKRAIGGHFFEILLANTRATHVSQSVGGELFRGVGLDSEDVHLGFNIVRRF